MLLTSSQASVLITSGIVLLCTSALFISGCLIQQRTLRDLRSAIRPAVVTRPRPKYWDEEAVLARRARVTKTTTIRLEDGTRVQIQGSGAEVVADPLPLQKQEQEQEEENGAGDGEVIEVRPTMPDIEEPLPPPPDGQPGDDNDDNAADGGRDDTELDVKGSWDGVQEGGVPLSRAERRKRIKAEIRRLSQGDTPVYYQRRLW
ncbi:hypothetical protein SAMD00023353_4200160 [Rosellinia necatrix]|uniref:Uncharacterized protein n=1 Tax=Rosellinia necatrix TaxID=77044 RepID=A0A1W2TP60_ROSNE|nr:hypothetical protein SAMD00023353_4200160 [Rosellinia necatrix]